MSQCLLLQNHLINSNLKFRPFMADLSQTIWTIVQDLLQFILYFSAIFLDSILPIECHYFAGLLTPRGKISLLLKVLDPWKIYIILEIKLFNLETLRKSLRWNFLLQIPTFRVWLFIYYFYFIFTFCSLFKKLIHLLPSYRDAQISNWKNLLQVSNILQSLKFH